MPDVVKSLIKLFADDTKLVSTVKNTLDLDTLQSDLDSLANWSQSWLMDFNLDKCKYMVINNKHFDIVLRMQDHELVNTSCEKDLGVYIDSNLKWSYQVNMAAKRANFILGQLKKAFICWNIFTLRKLYIAFVRPHLEYAVAAWNPYCKKDIKALERVQMRATKLVPSLKHLPYKERLDKLSLTTLQARRERGDLIEYFKINKGISAVDWYNPNKFCNAVNLDGPAGGIRGNNHRITKQLTRIRQREFFLTNRVVRAWNGLPEDVIHAESKLNFKRKLDEHLDKH